MISRYDTDSLVTEVQEIPKDKRKQFLSANKQFFQTVVFDQVSLLTALSLLDTDIRMPFVRAVNIDLSRLTDEVKICDFIVEFLKLTRRVNDVPMPDYVEIIKKHRHEKYFNITETPEYREYQAKLADIEKENVQRVTFLTSSLLKVQLDSFSNIDLLVELLSQVKSYPGACLQLAEAMRSAIQRGADLTRVTGLLDEKEKDRFGTQQHHYWHNLDYKVDADPEVQPSAPGFEMVAEILGTEFEDILDRYLQAKTPTSIVFNKLMKLLEDNNIPVQRKLEYCSLAATHEVFREVSGGTALFSNSLKEHQRKIKVILLEHLEQLQEQVRKDATLI